MNAERQKRPERMQDRRGSVGNRADRNSQSDERRRRKRARRLKRLRRRCLMILWGAAWISLVAAAGIWGVGKLQISRAKEKDREAGEDDAQNPQYETAADEGAIVGQADLPATINLDDPLLILVNKERGLPEDYDVRLRTLDAWPVSVAEALYEDLSDMLSDGVEEGLHFVVCSGYRSRERQQELLDEDIRTCMGQGLSYEEAYEEVTRETMPPGHSEHATGLALDIVARSYQLLDEGQEKTDECRWLQENAWRYGFILRYPKDKVDITGIDYESWHFRYVGKEAAKYMYENDLTLEELWGTVQDTG